MKRPGKFSVGGRSFSAAQIDAALDLDSGRRLSKATSPIGGLRNTPRSQRNTPSPAEKKSSNQRDREKNNMAVLSIRLDAARIAKLDHIGQKQYVGWRPRTRTEVIRDAIDHYLETMRQAATKSASKVDRGRAASRRSA